MFRRYGFATLAAAFLAVSPGRALAQYAHWELNLHAGLLYDDLFEEAHSEPIFGAAVMRHYDNGFGAGVNFDYVPAGQTIVYHNIREGDVNAYLYTFDVDYTIPSPGPLYFFLGSGVGAATVKIDSALVEADGGPRSGPGAGENRDFLKETQTNFLVAPFFGLKVLNSRTDPWFAFKIEARDPIIRFPRRIKTYPNLNEKTNTHRWTNNWALLAGFSFLFGGAPHPAPAPVVCPACPPPAPVTQPAPQPAMICADNEWWYTSDAPITVDGRTWIKFGSSRAIPRDDLVRIGEVGEIPVYVEHDAVQPWDQIWVPLCEEGYYQPYVPEREVRGTTG